MDPFTGNPDDVPQQGSLEGEIWNNRYYDFRSGSEPSWQPTVEFHDNEQYQSMECSLGAPGAPQAPESWEADTSTFCHVENTEPSFGQLPFLVNNNHINYDNASSGSSAYHWQPEASESPHLPSQFLTSPLSSNNCPSHSRGDPQVETEIETLAEETASAEYPEDRPEPNFNRPIPDDSELVALLQKNDEYRNLKIEKPKWVPANNQKEGSYWIVTFKDLPPGKNHRYVCSTRTNKGTVCTGICKDSRGINHHFRSKDHIGSHTKFFTCDPCNKVYSRQDSLMRHFKSVGHESVSQKEKVE